MFLPTSHPGWVLASITIPTTLVQLYFLYNPTTLTTQLSLSTINARAFTIVGLCTSFFNLLFVYQDNRAGYATYCATVTLCAVGFSMIGPPWSGLVGTEVVRGLLVGVALWLG
jgi:hypothetical protein